MMRCLLIDDEPLAISVVRDYLSAFATITVVQECGNGFEGIKAIAQHQPQLIFLDIQMPKINGFEMLELLDEPYPSIIFTTAFDEYAVKAFEVHAIDYLLKPFAFEELLARVKALSRRPKTRTDHILKIRDLTLDTLKFEVKRAGKQLNLSTKEFALLEYLMRHPNQTIPKNKIIEHVWNYDSDVLPNTVEVYVGYLRTKIDKPFKIPLLHTIRGFGYKIGSN